MAARNAELPDANLGLHRIGLVDDDHALGRLRRIDRLERPARRATASRRTPSRARPWPRRRYVADDGDQRVVRHEVALVEVDDVLPRQRAKRFGGAAAGQAVRVEAVDQPIDHLAGDVVRILRRHLQARHRLLALPLDLLRRERRPPHDVGHQLQRQRQAVLHHDRVDVGEVGAGAGAENAADEIDRVGDLFGGAIARALIEERRRQHRQPHLAFRILRRAGAHDHAHADRRLFVMADQHDLQAVGQLADLVGRKLHRLRRQRPRRPLAGPVRASPPARLRRRLRVGGRRHARAQQRGRQAEHAVGHPDAHAKRDHLRTSLRHHVQDDAALGREVGLRDALHVGQRDLLEDVELAVGGRDVGVNHLGVRQVRRLVLQRLAAEDVVARELVLRALQLAFGHAFGLQPVELGDERLLHLRPATCPGLTMATAKNRFGSSMMLPPPNAVSARPVSYTSLR